jgi:hypothetical protein
MRTASAIALVALCFLAPTATALAWIPPVLQLPHEQPPPSAPADATDVANGTANASAAPLAPASSPSQQPAKGSASSIQAVGYDTSGAGMAAIFALLMLVAAGLMWIKRA